MGSLRTLGRSGHNEFHVHTREVHHKESQVLSLYTENNTNLIYEVKLFEDFAIVRPIDRHMNEKMRKEDLITFDKNFREYSGIHDMVYEYLQGAETLEMETAA